MVPVTEVQIDPVVLSSCDETRRREWQAIAAEILKDGRFELAVGPHVLWVTSNEQATTFELRPEVGESIHVEVLRESVARFIGEYIDIVRRMAAEDLARHSVELEALDMAKKVTHDMAARTIERLCRPLGVDHDTARRLFTLLLAIRVDTTKITGIHSHRPLRK